MREKEMIQRERRWQEKERWKRTGIWMELRTRFNKWYSKIKGKGGARVSEEGMERRKVAEDSEIQVR